MDTSNTFDLYGKYKNLYVFNTGRGSILFRPLSYDKSQTAKRICDAYPALAPAVEDDIWKECVIESTIPETLDQMDAGLVSTIVRLILRFSNPADLAQIHSDLKEVRENTINIRDEIVLKICQAFPAYTPEDVEAMEWKTQLKRLVQAERILGTTFEFQKTPEVKPTKGPLVVDWEEENKVLAKA